MTYGFGETRGEGLVGLGIPGLYVEFVLVPLSPGAPSELRFHNTVLGFQVDPWSAECGSGVGTGSSLCAARPRMFSLCLFLY